MSSISIARLTIGALLILFVSVETSGKPRPQRFSPIKDVAMLDPEKVICTVTTAGLCQQCAKQTKSAVVYPWCCANHEGVREWCESYVKFGLE